MRALAILALAVGLSASPAFAGSRPDEHAPIGVMADHTHKRGEVMLSYRFMHMDMGGNRIGDHRISPDAIVTSVANPFAGNPGQPATLRIVPLAMRMDMHMLGVMYAPRDWLTLMAMGSYTTRQMPHLTYQGGTGTSRLGEFTTRARGFGDISLAGVFPVVRRHGLELNLRAGVSIPTGSLTEMDDVLTPMNQRPRVRLPYSMQAGSGTWDLLPGVTVWGHDGAMGWGAQYQGTIRTGTNGHGYRLGDSHMATVWASYMAAPWLSASLRLAGRTTRKIHGADATLAAPVQTADPDNYGGDRLDAFLGVNTIATSGPLKGYRLGLELGRPIYQDLNGPQMEENWSLTLGVQKAF